MGDTFEQLDHEPTSVTSAPWVRRAILVVLAVVAVLAVLDRFGQRPSVTAARAPAATLRLSAPAAVRGGLFFQSRLDVRAARAIEHPRIVLDAGWVEGSSSAPPMSSS